MRLERRHRGEGLNRLNRFRAERRQQPQEGHLDAVRQLHPPRWPSQVGRLRSPATKRLAASTPNAPTPIQLWSAHSRRSSATCSPENARSTPEVAGWQATTPIRIQLGRAGSVPVRTVERPPQSSFRDAPISSYDGRTSRAVNSAALAATVAEAGAKGIRIKRLPRRPASLSLARLMIPVFSGRLVMFPPPNSCSECETNVSAQATFFRFT